MALNCGSKRFHQRAQKLLLKKLQLQISLQAHLTRMASQLKGAAQAFHQIAAFDTKRQNFSGPTLKFCEYVDNKSTLCNAWSIPKIFVPTSFTYKCLKKLELPKSQNCDFRKTILNYFCYYTYIIHRMIESYSV